MTFKKIFDRNAAIDSGLLPIWLCACIGTLFWPSFRDSQQLLAGLIMPFGWLIGLHWLFRFGKWIEFRLRKR